jgi:adenine-specific DNA-methyltransferase
MHSRFRAQEDLFGNVRDADADSVRQLLVYLDTYLSPLTSFITREYSADAPSPAENARMFFTTANGQRIDAIRTQLHEWRLLQLLTDDEYFLLLSCLLESADIVANTTGVYAAYVKSWQGNALKPLRLVDPQLVTNTSLPCRAYQDANQFVRALAHVDVAYLDPPYNTRQYSSYYHVPEIIAAGWFDQEPRLRGKTGLIPDADKKSPWSVAGQCVEVFRDLIANLDAEYALRSYNSEGIISVDAVADIFGHYSVPGTFRQFEIDYARYRSDSDHEQRVYEAVE